MHTHRLAPAAWRRLESSSGMACVTWATAVSCVVSGAQRQLPRRGHAALGRPVVMRGNTHAAVDAAMHCGFGHAVHRRLILVEDGAGIAVAPPALRDR